LDWKGYHWRCRIPKLWNVIDPAKSRMEVKPSRVSLTFTKGERRVWG